MFYLGTCNYHQGERGNIFSPATKGERGILGFPGVRVSGHGRMNHACRMNQHFQTFINVFHSQGPAGFPGRDGQAGREVQPHDEHTLTMSPDLNLKKKSICACRVTLETEDFLV